ncbi:MAG TPA: general secretion pathway protein GspB [Thermodesulfobacteriota bacterium]|nr:general secretion pathway protein GspB [Thermodesulfobacteriota bacterium]
MSRGAEPAVREASSGPPQLKITGIAWQEEPSMRRAFVNGNFVREGSVVEGAKVVEILPTGVRFSFGENTFEVSAFK